MTNPHPQSPTFDLAPRDGTGRDIGPLLVDLEAFFEFSFDLAEDLEEMVAKHREANLPKISSRSSTEGLQLN